MPVIDPYCLANCARHLPLHKGEKQRGLNKKPLPLAVVIHQAEISKANLVPTIEHIRNLPFLVHFSWQGKRPWQIGAQRLPLQKVIPKFLPVQAYPKRTENRSGGK